MPSIERIAICLLSLVLAAFFGYPFTPDLGRFTGSVESAVSNSVQLLDAAGLPVPGDILPETNMAAVTAFLLMPQPETTPYYKFIKKSVANRGALDMTYLHEKLPSTTIVTDISPATGDFWLQIAPIPAILPNPFLTRSNRVQFCWTCSSPPQLKTGSIEQPLENVLTFYRHTSLPLVAAY